MSEFRQRNPVTIALVGLTVMVLALVTALNSEKLPIIGAGTTYQADFAEAGGLTPDNEVRIAGVKVGTVSDMEYVNHRIRVSFTVKDSWVGDRSAVAIKIKTVLGQKYLALDPSGDASMDPNEVIPTSRTTSAYEVSDAFQGLGRTAGEIDTGQLSASFDSMSQTFSNTPEHVRGALSGLSTLSGSIARRDGQLRELVSQTKNISSALAQRKGDVSRLIENGGALLDEVANRKQAISALLNGTRSLADQLRAVIDDNNAQLEPVLGHLDQFTSMLQRNQDSLREGIRNLAPFIRLFTNVVGHGRWFDGYVCGLILPALGPVNPQGCNEQ